MYDSRFTVSTLGHWLTHRLKGGLSRFDNRCTTTRQTPPVSYLLLFFTRWLILTNFPLFSVPEIAEALLPFFIFFGNDFFSANLKQTLQEILENILQKRGAISTSANQPSQHIQTHFAAHFCGPSNEREMISSTSAAVLFIGKHHLSSPLLLLHSPGPLFCFFESLFSLSS